MPLAQVVITQEELHFISMVGEYVLLPVVLWLGKRAIKSVIVDSRTILKKEIVDDLGTSFTHLDTKLGNHIKEDKIAFEIIEREVRDSFGKILNKLNMMDRVR
jgi:hypothetical protein